MTEDMMSKKSKKEKKAAKKKRKISKHILQANKDHDDLEKARSSERLPLDEEQVEAATAGALVKTSKKSSSSKDRTTTTPPSGTSTSGGTATNTHTKDVKEAAGYLTNWKNYRDQWKFNKNTQSWLIRHMYETDKVTKGTFTLLLEYLEGLQGKGAKDRILQDATRRALRYKRFVGEEEEEEEEKQTTVKFADDTKDDTTSENNKKRTKKVDPTATEDEKRWNELNDHDKRKEYKRARKILETLKSD